MKTRSFFCTCLIMIYVVMPLHTFSFSPQFSYKDTIDDFLNNTTINDTVKINKLYSLALETREKDMEGSLKISKKTYEYTTNRGLEAPVELIELIARNHYSFGHYKLSARFYTLGFEKLNKTKKSSRYAEYKNYAAFSYLFSGKNEKALELFIDNMKFIQGKNLDTVEISLYLGLGFVYRNIKKYDLGIEYFNKTLEKLKDTRIGHLKIAALRELGNLYLYKNEYNRSLKYHLEAIEIAEKNQDSALLGYSFNDIAQVYIATEDFDKALSYFFKALEIDKTKRNKWGICIKLYNIGNIYFRRKQLDSAWIMTQKAFTMAEELGGINEMAGLYELLSKIHYEKGEYAKAYEKLTLMTQYKDSLINKETAEKIAELRTEFETENKEKEITLLKKQKEINRLFNLSLIISAALLLILFFVYYNRNRLKKKSVQLLKKQNKEIKDQRNELIAKNEQINQQKEELTAQAEKLQEANEEIYRNSKLKELFFASTSHEIRTPLNVISGFANLLSKTRLDQKQQSYSQAILTSAKNLLVVVNDVLDYSKMEAGKLKLETIPFDIYKLIILFFNSIKIKADEKGIIMEKKMDEKIPPWIEGDPVRLNQILTNLCSNAIKFTGEQGKTGLKINLSQETEKLVWIRFEVWDTGIGIPEDKLSSIFEIYQQAEEHTTRKYGGTGLGLSIVKKLTEAQGGKIWVESSPAKGSRFFVEIPYLKTKKEKLVPDEIKEEAQGKLDGHSILLVDDNNLNLTLAVDTIREFNKNIRVHTAENGKEAIFMISKNNYDVIIMDVQMPEMDGIEATRKIRTELKKSINAFPVLGMSAYTNPEEKEKCMEAGMNDYLTKPFIPDELFEKIIKLTNKSIIRDKTQKQTKKERPIQNHTNYRYLDLNPLQKIYKKKKKKINKILKLTMINVPDQIGKLFYYIENNDFQNLKTTAHSLKTSLKYIGLHKTSETAREIEQADLHSVAKETVLSGIHSIKTEWEKVEKKKKNLLNT